MLKVLSDIWGVGHLPFSKGPFDKSGLQQQTHNLKLQTTLALLCIASKFTFEVTLGVLCLQFL